jgi:hypothetical protein
VKNKDLFHFSHVYELSLVNGRYVSSLNLLKNTKFVISSQNTSVSLEEIAQWEQLGKVVKVSVF